MSPLPEASRRQPLDVPVAQWHERIQATQAQRKENAELPRFKASNLNLRKASLAGLDLSDIDFDNCDFSGADLGDAKLIGSAFNNCLFGVTNFTGAQMQGARFAAGCDFEGADFSRCIATRAGFGLCTLRGVIAVDANFENAQFGASRLTDADFSDANLRGAKGLLLDETRVRSTKFSTRASDPWSILRRTYTGPRFTLNLVLLIAFVVSLIAKTFAFQVLALLQASPGIANGLAGYCKTNPCETVQLTSVILGFYEGPVTAFFVIASLVYNALRLGLTLGVAGLRDEEERSQRSPAYQMQRPWQGLRAAGRDLRQWYRWMYSAHRFVMLPAFAIVAVSFLLAAWDLLGDKVVIPVVVGAT